MKLPLWVMRLLHPSQAWFWTKEWQEGEREAAANIASGDVRTFSSSAEAIRWLNTREG